MQITSFNPLIVSNEAENIIKLFEEMGFETRHRKDGINDKDITSVNMRYTGEDGKEFGVDVTAAPRDKDISDISAAAGRDITSIRMNVRDFDETFKMLEERGFKNLQGDKVTDTGSSKSTMMASPSGFTISIVEHLK